MPQTWDLREDECHPTPYIWDTMGYSRQAGAMHPTRMLSCVYIVFKAC